MDKPVTVDRARAVVERLRDQLHEHQQREPNPRTMVPADLALLLNETLADLEGIYGTDWVRAISVNRWAFVPASNRNGANESFPTIQRDVLLGYAKGALRRLSVDAPMNEAHPGVNVSTPPAAGNSASQVEAASLGVPGA